ncbi:MAG: hypothetical protein KZY55_01280 [Paeniclostridium sp.]|nr:hypothetical protein [Paeniclostridium sp.]MBW4863746.1 hypothetical protein [Paeniclostridium sp.]MBW4872669.1 hypothetical protein [Paeniclostridium sp.]
MSNTVKLFGKITDFSKVPLNDAEIRLMDKDWNILYKTKSNENGYYELFVEKDIYFALYGCKDYKVNYLEFWGWNIHVFNDLEINMKTDGVEIYAINAFKVQYKLNGIDDTLHLYFRPMSLKRYNNLGENDYIIDITPKLELSDVSVKINDTKSNILSLDMVKEYSEENKYIYSYLTQVSIDRSIVNDELYEIKIYIKDYQTNEYGMGLLHYINK